MRVENSAVVTVDITFINYCLSIERTGAERVVRPYLWIAEAILALARPKVARGRVCMVTRGQGIKLYKLEARRLSGSVDRSVPGAGSSTTTCSSAWPSPPSPNPPFAQGGVI